MKPQQMANNFRELKTTLPDILGNLVKDNDHVVVDIQTEQLYAGLDGDGNKIEPAYSPFTVQIKRSKGQPTDRVTLKDTGDFYAGTFLASGGNNVFQIGNRDSKAAKLKQKYGNQILEMNTNSVQRLIDELVRPEIGKEAAKVISK